MSLETLRVAMSAPQPRAALDFDRSPRGSGQAAVLALLSRVEDPTLVLCKRAATMRSHAGQYALPGGRVDPGENMVQAALREANEEVGLSAKGVEILGELPAMWVPKSNYDVTAVVATWPGGELAAVDAAETEEVVQFRVSELADSGARITARHPSGFLGPAFRLGGAFIWGLTAHLIDWVLELGGWTKPWDGQRVVPIPVQYLQD